MEGDGSKRRAERVAFALLAEGFSVAVAVTGESMSPCLRSFDVLEVAPMTSPGRLGDVLVFPRAGGGMVVHRVVKVDGDGVLLMRGDAATESDGWVLPKYIAGRVVAAQRDGAAVRHGLGPEAGWIARLSRWGVLVYLLSPIRRWVRSGSRVARRSNESSAEPMAKPTAEP